MKRVWALIAGTSLLVVLLSGCSSDPDSLVHIYTQPRGGLSTEQLEQMETYLNEQTDDDITVKVLGHDTFDEGRLFKELSIGKYEIFLISKEEFDYYVEELAFRPMDPYFDPEKYPEGVETVQWQRNYGLGTEEATYLYGIPVKNTALGEALDYQDEDWYIAMPPRLEPPPQIAEVLKTIVNGKPADPSASTH